MQDPNSTYDHLKDEMNTLDRVWAVTRPIEPSKVLSDQMWARVQAGLDAPVAFAMPEQTGWSRKKLVLVVVGLAQAAAVLIGIWVTNRPVQVGRQNPSALVARLEPKTFDLENDETLVVNIDGNVIENRRVTSNEPQALALNDLPVNDHYLALSSMESLSHE